MQLLALALCLCHAWAFGGVITARVSVNTQRMQQADQRLANAAVRRGRDVMDKLGEHLFLVVDRKRARRTQENRLRLIVGVGGSDTLSKPCSTLRACFVHT